MIDNLRRKLKIHKSLNLFVRAGSILALGSFLENLFRFFRNMILARLLAPDAFGLMATVLASVAVMEAFTEIGLKDSVIQHKQGGEEKFINIIWWFASIRGIVLYMIGFFLAPLICDFYSKPELLSLIRVGFIAILFNGLISPKVYVLLKEMRLKGWVLLMQGSGTLGVIITITIALFYPNTWALVIGYVVEAFLRSFLSFIFYPIRPSFIIHKPFMNDIMFFSKKMFGLPILMLLFVQTDIFVIGKVMSMTDLGFYTLAKNLAEMPNTFLTKFIQPIIFPTLAKIQDDKAKLRISILSLTKWTMAFGLPFIAFLVIFAVPILSIVYGSKYIIVAIPFGFLSISNLILLCSSFFMNTFIAVGQPDIHRNASFIRTSLFLIIIYPATLFGGLSGAACTVLLVMSVLLIIQIFSAKRLLQIGYLDYFHACLEGIKLSIIVILPGYILNICNLTETLTGFFIGIVLCLISWGYAIVKMVRTYKKELL